MPCNRPDDHCPPCYLLPSPGWLSECLFVYCAYVMYVECISITDSRTHPLAHPRPHHCAFRSGNSDLSADDSIMGYIDMLLLQLGVFAHFYRYPYLFFLQFHFTLREEWSSHTKRQNRLLTRLVGTTNALRFSGLAIYCTFAGFVGRVYFRQHGAGQLSCAGDATARHCDVFRDEICIYLGHSYKRWSVLVGRGGRARKE